MFEHPYTSFIITPCRIYQTLRRLWIALIKGSLIMSYYYTYEMICDVEDSLENSQVAQTRK